MMAHSCFRLLPCCLLSVTGMGLWIHAGEIGGAKPKAEDAAWVQDASRATFPDHSTRGRVHGQPFTADVVTASPYHATSGKAGDPPARRAHVDGITLTLRQGRRVVGANAFVIFCVTKPGESVEGKTFVLPSGGLFKQTEKIMDKDGKGSFSPVAGVQIHWKARNGKAGAELFPKATMRLTFGKWKNGKLPGQIYLCIDDRQKSFVAGSFKAVEKPGQKTK